MTPAEWLARVRHDLVKRLVWPARDRRDMGGNPAPGELVPDLIDDEGRPITAPALWAALAADAPPGADTAAFAGGRRGARPRPPQAGDVAGVIALEAAFAALARSLEGRDVDAPPTRDRRPRPDGRDGPAPAAGVRHRHPLRSPHPVPGVRGARARLPAALRARLWRGGAGAGARCDTLPDLVVLDLHFALPEERLLPEDKSSLPADPKRAKDGARRAAAQAGPADPREAARRAIRRFRWSC